MSIKYFLTKVILDSCGFYGDIYRASEQFRDTKINIAEINANLWTWRKVSCDVCGGWRRWCEVFVLNSLNDSWQDWFPLQPPLARHSCIVQENSSFVLHSNTYFHSQNVDINEVSCSDFIKWVKKKYLKI